MHGSGQHLKLPTLRGATQTRPKRHVASSTLSLFRQKTQMPKRQTGGLLIIVGVIVALVTSAVAVAGGTAMVAVGAPGYLLTVACLGLLGVGVALLSVDGPIFGGTLARRGLKTLAFGLVGDFVTLGLLALPGLEGSNAMVLFIPFFVIGWATIIGAGLTVLALVVAGGRPRRVGATFLAAPVALFAVNALVNTLSGTEGARLLATALAIVAGSALLLGFVGLALLAIDGPTERRGA
jgi:hypothetical protein